MNFPWKNLEKKMSIHEGEYFNSSTRKVSIEINNAMSILGLPYRDTGRDLPTRA